MDADKARLEAKRGRGRPKASEPGTTLCTWLRATEYDKLVKLANKRETSVSALARQRILGTRHFPTK